MITTNFTTEKYLVLTNNEDKIMAIIKCELGTQDISEKVKQAISEDENANNVDLLNSFEINSSGINYILHAEVEDEFGDKDNFYYNLII